MPANTAPLPALTLPADAQPAEIFTQFMAILEPRVNGAIYQIVITNCLCGDRSLYYGHAAGRQTNHIYCVCTLHGVQDCGIALRADCLPARSSEAQERRRKSGYTTRRWYSQRGM